MGTGRTTADHVTQVLLGQFVVAQVEGGEAFGPQGPDHPRAVARAGDLQADEQVGLGGVGHAVVELGDAVALEHGAEAAKRTTLLGNRHRQHRFARLADFGAFGDEAQTVEVHVGSASDGDHGPAAHGMLGSPGFHAGHGQRAGRFEDAARVLENVLDRGADRIGIDPYDFVDEFAADAECLLADLFDRGTVAEQADVLEPDPPTRLDRAGHGVGIERLHADDADLGPDRLHVRGNARDQPAATDGDEDGLERVRMLAQDFHADRALPGNHVGIVERMHEDEPAAFAQRIGVGLGIRIGFAAQDDLDALAADRMHRVDLDLRRGYRHHDHGTAIEPGCGQGDALGMVAGRGGDHATLELGPAQRSHLVVGAAQLERKHRLVVLALEQHRAASAR